MVEDRSDFHNFHLSGPGVSLATDVEAVEKVTWDVVFVEGRYTFVCDPHATQMKGAFTVGNPPPLPVPTRLVATVGPSNTITLTRNGARVRTLTAGAYVIVVRDRSKRHNFHLTGPGVNRKTVVGRTATVTWNVTLGPGTFRYASDPQAKRVRGSFAVTPRLTAAPRRAASPPSGSAARPGRPSAWMSACRSSSAFSSAPKSSAIAE